MKKNLLTSAFITMLALFSQSAFSQTAETFPNTFNTAGTQNFDGTFTGNQGTWTVLTGANSIIEVDALTNISTPNSLRLANNNTSGATQGVATSPRISLVYNACTPSALALTFQFQPVDAGNNTNYTLSLEFSSNDGSTWASSGWSQTSAQLTANGVEDVWNAASVTIPVSYWNPNFRYRFVSNRTTGNSVNATLIDDIAFAPVTTGPAFPDFSDATPTKTTDGGAVGGSFEVGDVYRFDNVVTSPFGIYAEVKIEAISNAIITNLDNNAAGIAQRFQPRIRPDVLPLTADREGYVQFAITFKKNSDNTLAFLDGLRYRHFDVDGSQDVSGTDAYTFRETGWITGQSGLLVNTPNDLTNAGVFVSGPPAGTSWTKVLGELAEHTGITSDPDVYFTATYGSINTLRFRLGYTFDETSSAASYDPGSEGREYGTEFGCFDLVDQITLPVTLINFSGGYKGGVTHLNWLTENMINFDRFEVERSTNGINFSTIGTRTPANSTISLRSMYNLDDNLAAETATAFYYRLKMIDLDGKFSYSNIILVRKDQTIVGLSISPNPASSSSTATVRFQATAKGVVDLKIVDMAGRVMLQQQNNVTEGVNSVSISKLGRLQPGVYVVQVNDGTSTVQTTKFIVSK